MTKACKTCGEDFVALRSTGKYCSDKCRYHEHLTKKKRVDLPADMRFSVFHRDGFRCRYCGDAPSERRHLRVDHIVSLEDGGPRTDMANLITACNLCNAGKGARSVDPAVIPPVAP